MVSSAFTTAALIMSGALMVTAPSSIIFAHRNYTEAQRTSAATLYHLYLVGVVCVSIVGTAVFVWILTEGVPTIWITAILPVIPLPISVIQWKLHKEMGYTGWFGTA